MSPLTTFSAQASLSDEAKLVDLLADPRMYPDRPATVQVVETHISWVFLTDRHAYKLKKPVSFDFLDFSTPELRREACCNEVRLNRRLAPDVYLSVVPVNKAQSGRLRIGGSGAHVDWLVKMRRLPDERSLASLIGSASVTETDVKMIAERLVAFYGQSPPLALRTEEFRREIEAHVAANRDVLLTYCPPEYRGSVLRAHAAQLRAMRLHPEAFDARVCDGRIVDGHGDLRPDHIYLNPRPTIIDCIEFNDEMRRLDVLDELSFLAVECAALDAPGLGGQILDHYCRLSGDMPPAKLLSFYMSYRASVRAKVNMLRSRQLADVERRDAMDLATRYLHLAAHYAEELGPPLLIVVRGLSGTGKSTLASAVAADMGIEQLSTDATRRDLFGHQPQDASFEKGIYHPEHREKVYETIFARAREKLADGYSVVLDGTFLTTHLRAQAASLARRQGAMPVVVHCVCPDEIAAARIAARGDGVSLSDARPEFVRRQRVLEEPDPPGTAACEVDTTASPPGMLVEVYQHLKTVLRECDAW